MKEKKPIFMKTFVEQNYVLHVTYSLQSSRNTNNNNFIQNK